MAPTLAELDARSRRWPRPARWLYLTVKWTLVALGAYLLVGWYVVTWGWAAGLWFLGAPFVYGLIKGWPRRSGTPAPPPSDAARRE